MKTLSAEYEEAKKHVNARLKEKGIPYTLHDFWNDRSVCAAHAPDLLELFKIEISLPSKTRSLIAYGMFNGKLDSSQKREAVSLFLKFVKQNPGASLLDIVILNGFGKNFHPDDVHEIGQMTLDRHYGNLRSSFTDVLRCIGTPEAVSYLLKAARDPLTAPLALHALARLRVDGTLALFEEALNRKFILHKDAIRETWLKLKRQLAKKQAGLKHVTRHEIQTGLTEWSANLDAPQLPKVLRCVQRCCTSGFAKEEISEVRSVSDNLSPEQTVRFKFEVVFGGRKTLLWIEVFCDDEDAYDIYLYGQAKLIGQIEKALSKVIS